MKKLLLGIVILIITTAIAIPLLLSNADKSINLCILGDSIASGYGVDTSNSYASIIANDLGMIATNKAVNGYTTDDLISQISDEANSSELKNADVIIISIAGNDFLRQGQQIINYYKNLDLNNLQQLISSTTQKISSNLNTAVSKLVSMNSNVKIILQTLYTTNYNGMKDVLEMYIDSYNQVYYNTANDFPDNILVSDVRTAFKNSTQNCIATDGIHPNSYGHRLIATTIENTLSTLGYTKITTEKSTAVSSNIKGDVDNDGKVSISDELKLKKYLANIEFEINIYNSDINGDSIVDLKDSLTLLKTYV